MGLDNVDVMLPFVRSVEEGEKMLQQMQGHDLVKGEHGLKVFLMCEIPANILLAEEFLQHFDGFSIGSNDLTQLTLGVGRDSGLITGLDERNPAVKNDGNGHRRLSCGRQIRGYLWPGTIGFSGDYPLAGAAWNIVPVTQPG